MLQNGKFLNLQNSLQLGCGEFHHKKRFLNIYVTQ